MNKLQLIHNNATRILVKAKKLKHITPIPRTLHWCQPKPHTLQIRTSFTLSKLSSASWEIRLSMLLHRICETLFPSTSGAITVTLIITINKCKWDAKYDQSPMKIPGAFWSMKCWRTLVTEWVKTLHGIELCVPFVALQLSMHMFTLQDLTSLVLMYGSFAW